jgi:hypothetical protein
MPVHKLGEVPESGRSGLPAKEVWCNSHRGFESHPLRVEGAGDSAAAGTEPELAGSAPAEPFALHPGLQSESLFIRSAGRGGWPAGACRPPSWELWENTTPLPSGRRLTAMSPLVEFRSWRVEAKKDIRVFGLLAAGQFAEGWRFGVDRERRRAS